MLVILLVSEAFQNVLVKVDRIETRWEDGGGKQALRSRVYRVFGDISKEVNEVINKVNIL